MKQRKDRKNRVNSGVQLGIVGYVI